MMTLKQFMEMTFKKNMFAAMTTARDLIELSSIEERIKLYWGVELDIKVKPVKREEGRFYGKNVIKAIEREFKPKK